MTSDAKRYIRTIFDEAEDYDRNVGFFATFGAHLVEQSGVRSGDRVLDLCCGRGASLVPAAVAVGDGGSAIGVDLSPEMVRRSNAALADAGVGERAGAVVGEIERLEFDDAAFDKVHCGFGVFFADDVPGMLGGVHRVLRSGGQFAFTLFAGPPFWPWLTEIIVANTDLEPGTQHPMWTFDSAGRELENAGFEEPTRHDVTETIVIPSLDTLWTQLWSLGTRPMLESMDETTLQRVRSEIGERLEDHRIDGGYESESTVTIVLARKPA